jgi:hypothetical protein
MWAQKIAELEDKIEINKRVENLNEIELTLQCFFVLVMSKASTPSLLVFVCVCVCVCVCV